MLLPGLLAGLSLQAADPAPDRLALPPVKHVADVAVTEVLNDGASSRLKETLLAGLLTSDWKRVEDAFTEDARGRFPRPDAGRPVGDDVFLVRELEGLALEPVGRAGLVAALRAHTERWTSVDRAGLKFHHFLLDAETGGVFASGHLVLAGPRVDGGRSELHATVDLRLVVTEEPKQVRIAALELVSGHLLTFLEEGFVDVSDAVGFRFGLSAENRELNQQFLDDRSLLTIGGVNVLDWNRDGFWDLLATRRDQETTLFLNDGRGGFVPGKLPLDVPRESAYSVLFVDLDGDGAEELVAAQVLGYGPNEAWIGLHTRVDGGWRRLERAFTFRLDSGVRGPSVQSIVPADVDGDGDLDLFFCVHSDSRSGKAEYNSFAAFDGGDNLLFINQGGLRFTEESDARGITGRQYTYVAQFFDFDGDGDADLVEGNDYGPNWYYENVGQGRFERRPEHALSGRSSYTMGVTMGDFDGDGAWDLNLSNMYSHAGQRISQVTEGLSDGARAAVAAMARGNQLFSLVDGAWTERAVDLGIEECGWAWASVFFDVENDGDLDLFVTNGNTSNRDKQAPDW